MRKKVQVAKERDVTRESKAVSSPQNSLSSYMGKGGWTLQDQSR